MPTRSTQSAKSRKAGVAKSAGAIQFSAVLQKPAATAKSDTWTFLTLPSEASGRLPSRGMVAVEGTMNGAAFEATLEPDGRGGHWLKVEKKLATSAGVAAGDEVEVELCLATKEPESTVPPDFRAALAAAGAKVRDAWMDITPAARRDFVFWVVSPKKAETRAKRIETACDMLAKGKRRPCCFDRSGMYSQSLECPVAEEPASPPTSAARTDSKPAKDAAAARRGGRRTLANP